MWKELKGFELPSDKSIKTWRYMSFDKLSSLFEEKALYFASAAQLEDVFEGSLSDQAFMDYSDPSLELNELELKIAKKIHRNYRYGINAIYKSLKELIKINCWHTNEHESAAMWKIYAGDKKSIAIQTSMERLCGSLQEYRIKPNYGLEQIWIGKVKYIDFKKDKMNKSDLDRFFYKRASFGFENELRIAISLITASQFVPDFPSLGIFVPVNLNTLIERIYISPLADNDVEENVKNLLSKYDYNFEVVHSDLNSDPVY